MPWTPKDVAKHNKSADPQKWAPIANAILRKGGDEIKAIKIANSKSPKKVSKGSKK